MTRLRLCAIPLVQLFLQVLLFSSIAITTVQAQACDANGVCDQDVLCPVWKQQGKCQKDPDYMQEHCPITCEHNYAATTPNAEELIAKSAEFGVLQEATGERKEQTMEVIVNSIEYMNKLQSTRTPRLRKCINQHEYCSFWVTMGECESNDAWMRKNCGPACRNCHKFRVSK